MQKFRVRCGNWNPFTIATFTNDNKTHLRGIVKEIYEGMRAVFGFDYEANLQPGNIFGHRSANGTWSGMIGSLINNETDIAGPFLVNEERSLNVEISVPLGFSNLGIISGMVPTNKHTFLIFEIFSVQIWIALLLSLIIVSGAACIIYQVLPSSEKRPGIEAFSKYFWSFHASLLGQDFGSNDRWFLKHVYTSPSFQLLQRIWLLTACFVLMNIYRGAIISAFAAVKLKPKIETMEQLFKDTSVGIGTFNQTNPHSFFMSLVGTKYENIVLRMKENLVPMNIGGTIPNWMDPVEKGELVIVGETAHMINLVGERFLKTGKCGLRVTIINLGASFISIGFRKHFHSTSILKKFNKVIRHFGEGNLAHLEHLNSSFYYDICTLSDSTVIKALNFSDLIGAFIVFITGIFLSFFVFTIELLFKPKDIRG